MKKLILALLLFCSTTLHSVNTQVNPSPTQQNLEEAYQLEEPWENAPPTPRQLENPEEKHKRILTYSFAGLCCFGTLTFLVIKQLMTPEINQHIYDQVPCSLLCEYTQQNMNQARGLPEAYYVQFKNNPNRKILIHCDKPQGNITIVESNKYGKLGQYGFNEFLNDLPVCGDGVIQEDLEDVIPDLIDINETTN